MTGQSLPLPFTPPVALTIAGSDSGGGAGIAADLKTFAAHGVFGTLAITAITAQDTAGVHNAIPVDPSLLDAQIDAVLGDFPVSVAKTGMLATLELLELIIDRVKTKRLPPLVVDPVMVSTSGAALFEGDAAAAYRRLLPYALVLTPNLPEAEALLGTRVKYLSDMRDAAKALHDLGPQVVVVKGGHLPGPRAVDVVAGGGELLELGFPMVQTRNVHGSGCTLSAAIAANLALGYSPVDSVRRARVFVTDAIVRSSNWVLGSGHGPLDHFGAVVPRGRH
ncbi:MAG TPA: bifunctional hydroxymethylpyrimidine kinase/phosphomethylpyrimidine kinase [Acidimicrobiales bacterium]|nr:bifunctional hydroxymethylpyrimidine kinase/phosphomethylpyrimidine kinase [Acidimicrobiales bacterium]